MTRLFAGVVTAALFLCLTGPLAIADSAATDRHRPDLGLDPFESPEAFAELLAELQGGQQNEKKPASEVRENAATERGSDATAESTASGDDDVGASSRTASDDMPSDSNGAQAPPSDAPGGEAATGDGKQPANTGVTADKATPSTPTDSDAADRIGESDQGSPTVEDKKVESAPPHKELNQQMAQLRDRVRYTLRSHLSADFTVQSSTATDIMHYCLAFGVKAGVRTATHQRPISGIGCLCYNYSFRGYRPLTLVDHLPAARVGYGLEAHPSQLVALLAQSRVKTNYPLRVGKVKANVADLVEYEKATCRSESDMALKLVGLSYYVGTNQSWENRAGQQWTVDRIIRAEMDKSIVDAPCGGVHRLMGLSHAVQRRVTDGLPVTGGYQRAHRYLVAFHDHALKLQNPDGSWHPKFFCARGFSRDHAGNLRSTGMILEWLACSLPRAKLEDPRVVKSVDYVNNLLNSRRFSGDTPALSAREIASVMHAAHALRLYDERVFKPADPPAQEQEVAQRDGLIRD